jgi:uncharacterized protein YbjT (DUF2867 family)
MKVAVVGATGRVGHHAVDVLEERGHEVVAISRSAGVDVITGDGLAAAMTDVDAVIDAATGPSPDEEQATEFFTTAARNLEQAAERAGVRRIVVVSIIGTDQATAGYGAAKKAHERAYASGPVPARIVRAAQFHEFVPVLMQWGREGDVIYLPPMRTQLVAARTVAEVLADEATAPEPASGSAQVKISEVAGPREENLAEMAALYAARRADTAKIEVVADPNDPNTGLNESGALLPGPDAVLAGPTFEEWLDATS